MWHLIALEEQKHLIKKLMQQTEPDLLNQN